ncbi:MAG: phasin family protein [Oceanicaulis sp.]|nr:phasin family protein [Oceanicaulis sp.]
MHRRTERRQSGLRQENHGRRHDRRQIHGCAKSVQELIEIQSDYTKSSMDALLAEMNKSSDLMSSLFKDSFKPINERFSAALELMQSQR